MAEVAIALAATNAQWAERLTEWVTDHGGKARLRDSYLYTREDALAQDYDCLVGDAESTLFEASFVAALQGLGRFVVGIADPARPATRRRLEHLGVDAVVDRSAEPDEVLRAVLDLAGRREFDSLVSGLDPFEVDEPPAGSQADDDLPPPRPSCLTVVTGPVEGVGATEIAIELTAQLRRLGETAVLVDADLVRPCLAQRLRAPLTPNLNTAVDIVTRRGGTIARSLVLQPQGGFDLLPGLEHPKHWADLHPSEVTDVLARLRLIRSHVVVNVGSLLEDLPGPAAARHAVARRLVTAADRIVVAAEPTAIGVQGLCRWAVDVAELNDLGRVHVAFNRGSGRDLAQQLERETRRAFTPATVDLLPDDPRVGRARWGGHLVRHGPFLRAVRTLTRRVTPRLPTARPRGRKARS
jgi:MinD-like ATPase involved in chromosome partitioning or flagellar assembly